MRALMGMVQALGMAGSRTARSRSATMSSSVMRSRQKARRIDLAHPGAQEEYHRFVSRHCSSGLSWITVSIIEKGAGSVAVSARPAFPKTRSTSGTVRMRRSCTWRMRWASVWLRPGRVEGM